MQILIHPLSFLSRRVATGLPTFFQTIPAILMIFYVCFAIGRKGKKFDLKFSSGMIYFIVLIFITQALAIIDTIINFPITGVSIYERYGHFLLLVAYVIVGYLFMKNALDTEQKIVNFFKGVYITFGVLLVLLFMQLAFIHSGLFEQPLSWIMANFSQQPYSDFGLFAQGINYLTSERMPNGLDPESRDVAIRIILTCLPFMLAAFRNRLPFKGSLLLGKTIQISTIALACLVLFLIATRTGFILAVLTIVLFLLYLFTERQTHDALVKRVSITLFVLICLVFLIFTFSNASEEITEILFDTRGGNRRASIIATLRTFLQHPIIGVGYHFSDPWNIMNAPLEWANNPININNYLPHNALPPLSVLFVWLAQFGLIIVLPFFAYFVRLKLDFTMLVERLNETQCTPWQKSFFGTINDAYFLFIIYFIPTSFLLFDWSGMSYLLVLLYFVVSKSYLKEYLNQIAPIGESEEMN